MFSFPWEEGIKPFHVNEKGYEWYFDKQVQKHVDRYALSGIKAVFIRRDNEIIRGLIEKGELIYANQSIEAMGCFIDVLSFEAKKDKNDTTTT